MKFILIAVIIAISVFVSSVHADLTFDLMFSTPYIHPESIAVHGGYLWISDNAAYKMHRLNHSDGSVITSVDYMLPGLTFVGDYLYGVGDHENIIYKINPEDGTILSSLTLQFDIPGPCSLAYDGHYFWIGNGRFYSRIYKADPSDGSLVESFDYGTNFCPAGLAHDGANLWIAEYNPDKIHIANPVDGSIISSFDAPDAGPGGNPAGLDLDDEYYLWTIIAGTGNIYRTTEPIPEPSTILLLTTGLGGMAAYGFRRRKKS